MIKLTYVLNLEPFVFYALFYIFHYNSLSRLNIPDEKKQLPLFGNTDRLSEKRKDLNTALDFLQEKFGRNVVRPGTLVDKE